MKPLSQNNQEDNPRSAIGIDYILFIEWLSSTDIKTGHSLHKWIQARVSSPLRSEYRRCESKTDVVNALREATSNLSTFGTPLIQIDAHGLDSDQRSSGGMTSNKGPENIAWEDIWKELRILNAASGFNLIVIAASCYGALGHRGVLDSIRSIDKLGIEATEPAPYIASIGFEGEVTEKSLHDSLKEFYRSLLNTGRLMVAIEDANRELVANEQLTIVWLRKVVALSLRALSEGEPEKDLRARVIRAYPRAREDEIRKRMAELTAYTRDLGEKVLQRMLGSQHDEDAVVQM